MNVNKIITIFGVVSIMSAVSAAIYTNIAPLPSARLNAFTTNTAANAIGSQNIVTNTDTGTNGLALLANILVSSNGLYLLPNSLTNIPATPPVAGMAFILNSNGSIFFMLSEPGSNVWTKTVHFVSP